MKTRTILAVLMTLAVIAPAITYAQCHYTSFVVDPIDCGLWTQGYAPTAINEHGVVSGYYSKCDGSGEVPFVWHESTGRVDLAIPEGFESARALDLNNHGLVVGCASRDNPAPYNVAVAWVDGELHVIGALEGDNLAEAKAVNDHGIVVGSSNSSLGGPVRGFRWSVDDGVDVIAHPDGQTTIRPRDINNLGVIVGQTFVPPGPFGQRGLIVDGDEILILDPLPGAMSSDLHQINDAGVMFGYGLFDDDGVPRRRMAIWRGGEVSMLIPESIAFAQNTGEMNHWGQVVGYALESVSGWPYLADARGVRSLDDWVDIPEGIVSVGGPDAINDLGQIVTSGGSGFLVLTPIRTSGDVTADCRVDFDDLLAVLATWGSCNVPCSTDLNGDRQVAMPDLAAVLRNWTP